MQGETVWNWIRRGCIVCNRSMEKPGGLLVMGRLGIGGFDAVDLDGFEGIADFLLEGLHFGDASALIEDDLVELIVLMLEVSQVRFNFSETVGKFLIHE